jgi:hypothetical protein
MLISNFYYRKISVLQTCGGVLGGFAMKEPKRGQTFYRSMVGAKCADFCLVDWHILRNMRINNFLRICDLLAYLFVDLRLGV